MRKHRPLPSPFPSPLPLSTGEETLPSPLPPPSLHRTKTDADGNWRVEVIKRLEKLKNLDGSLIDDEEREQAKAES